jgi:antitoxin HigA-1
MEHLKPIHPGEILKEEFMQPLHLSASSLAKALGIERSRMAAIVRGTRSITADTALRLARAFNMSPQFWLNLQRQYDLDMEQSMRDYSALPCLLQEKKH